MKVTTVKHEDDMSMEEFSKLIDEKSKLDLALGTFCNDLWKKLHKKAESGLRGWDDPWLRTRMLICLQDLAMHSDGQEIDIAAYAMFLWNLRRKSGERMVNGNERRKSHAKDQASQKDG